MLTKDENKRLTLVGADTPMGKLMRRYWHPVGVASELDADPVQKVRILGEDLVLFRDERGRLGLVAHACPHRGVSLAYGIPQHNGLRCCYHGWAIDTDGRVVDMPFEPACLPLKIPAYPVQELAGLIWAYLGPEPAPLLPRWDTLVREDFDRSVTITALDCNWLQCMDNSLDPIHFEHLHGHFGNYVMKQLGRRPMVNPRPHRKIDFDVFEYGIYKRRLVEGEPEDAPDWRLGHPILFPNILGQGNSDQMSFQIRTPTDDTHTMHYVVVANRRKDGAPPRPTTFVRQTLPYGQMGKIVADAIVVQDETAWVEQGPITDRASEHLVTSDKGILLYRKLLLANIEKVERGEDPMTVIRDPEVNEPMISIARGSQYSAFHVGVSSEDYGGVRRIPVGVGR